MQLKRSRAYILLLLSFLNVNNLHGCPDSQDRSSRAWRTNTDTWHHVHMLKMFRAGALVAILIVLGASCSAVQLKVSRAALQRTLEIQLFGGPGGRYYLKGSPKSPCYVYAQDPTCASSRDASS